MRHLYTLDQGIDKHREIPKVARRFSGSERIPQTKPTEGSDYQEKVYNTPISLVGKTLSSPSYIFITNPQYKYEP
jgi:hypothetical protein